MSPYKRDMPQISIFNYQQIRSEKIYINKLHMFHSRVQENRKPHWDMMRKMRGRDTDRQK